MTIYEPGRKPGFNGIGILMEAYIVGKKPPCTALITVWRIQTGLVWEDFDRCSHRKFVFQMRRIVVDTGIAWEVWLILQQRVGLALGGRESDYRENVLEELNVSFSI